MMGGEKQRSSPGRRWNRSKNHCGGQAHIAKETEGPMVIEGAGKFLRDLLGSRYKRSGKCEAGMDRTLKERHELMVQGNACVPQQRSESEDEIREEDESCGFER